MEPVIFLILDAESGNAVAEFEHLDQARDALIAMEREIPDEASSFAIIAFDKVGNALETTTLADLATSA